MSEWATGSFELKAIEPFLCSLFMCSRHLVNLSSCRKYAKKDCIHKRKQQTDWYTNEPGKKQTRNKGNADNYCNAMRENWRKVSPSNTFDAKVGWDRLCSIVFREEDSRRTNTKHRQHRRQPVHQVPLTGSGSSQIKNSRSTLEIGLLVFFRPNGPTGGSRACDQNWEASLGKSCTKGEVQDESQIWISLGSWHS